MVAALLVPLSSARWLITSWRPGLASSSGKGYSTDSDKDDKDMEGRVFGQMCRNCASTRRAAAAFFVLLGGRGESWLGEAPDGSGGPAGGAPRHLDLRHLAWSHGLEGGDLKRHMNERHSIVTK